MNDHLWEYQRECALPAEGSLLPVVLHTKDCNTCVVKFENATLIEGHLERCGRVAIEAFKITSCHNVATPSLTLLRLEIDFLQPEMI